MKIGSIIVTFNPRIEQLRLVLNALAKQTQKIRIVDNNSAQTLFLLSLNRQALVRDVSVLVLVNYS